MGVNIIKEYLHHRYSCKVCEVFQKRLSESVFWLTAFDFRQRFRRIISKTCLQSFAKNIGKIAQVQKKL